jgi:prepilin-type N-terminal cleavage/methylation domain-containing protein
VSRGFTFLEILIVMAVMGVLMGIGIGFLQNIGAASRVDQARGILRETVYACKQSSNGGTRAILDIHYRERDDALVVGAAVARPVLTHNFETLDSTSNDYPVRVEGNVEIVKGGYFGAAAKFQGGSLVFDPQSAFATTDGLSIDGYFLPVTGASTMSLVTGEGAYKLQLVRDPESQGYDVVFALDLKEPGEGRTASSQKVFRTKGGPFRPELGWTHLQVGYDGADASILVNGIECESGRQARRRGQSSAAEEAGHRRLVVPDGGAVRLVLGGTSTPYSGLMDTLVIGGVFRSSDTERELYGLKLVRRGDKPVKITYRNGRLDPARHAGDVLLYLEESTSTGGPLLEVKLGMYGTVEDRLVAGDR